MCHLQSVLDGFVLLCVSEL